MNCEGKKCDVDKGELDRMIASETERALVAWGTASLDAERSAGT